MKAILTALLMVSVAEADYWRHNPWGPNWQNPSYPFGTYPQRLPDARWFQPPPGTDVNINTAEWVCRNPKTGDMMIISSDDEADRTPGNGRPWHQHQNQNNHGNHGWPNQNGYPIHPTTASPTTERVTTTTTEAPVYHGGEGLLDIRMGVER